MRLSKEIRDSFREFFRQRDHEIVSSGPLVPPNDPTLMFTNAGMVQFKDAFTGQEIRDCRRACSCQKCIRISGKHNDLENVGVTARHHTFFEMLGNFSFGDYFKEEAITYGWEYLTQVLGIPAERLVVTVFGGEGDIPADVEAERIWRRVSGLPDERIQRLGAKDNFWQMGDTGPCGPCSEIHFYSGPGEPPLSEFGREPGADGRGWLELWNLVFTQFDRQPHGRLEPLPAPSIDTGAGLERLAAVQQGVLSNYDSDSLRPMVDVAAQISGKSYGGTMNPDDVSMRVIADHARMTAFLIAEGVFPDRDGRPYVLRRIMRRAIRHAHRLGIRRVCFHECALRVVDVMGGEYPELVERRALIEQVTQQEEERFRATLKRGLEHLEGYKWPSAGQRPRQLPGAVAFELHDTFGFPLDLQEVIGQEQGFTVDREGFERELALARERAAGSRVGEAAVDAIYRDLANRLRVVFVGYDTEASEAPVAALLSEGHAVDQLTQGQSGDLVAERTPFYAESGGQVGDKGVVRTPTGVFEVRDTVRPVGELTVHRGEVVQGWLGVDQPAEFVVDHVLRSATRRNHSATHLLHFALRQVVGAHAMQKGSLVGAERLRFDYSGAKPLTGEQLRRIEEIVNETVLCDLPLETQVLPMADAKQKGAIGIFEEKYGDVVRMVRMGESRELCGGTHVCRTGEIGAFKIISESAIAAGVRRVEAATGLNVLKYICELEQQLSTIATLVKGSMLQASEKVERLIERQKELTREVDRLNRKLVSGGTQDLTSHARKVGEVNVLGTRVELGGLSAMRELADQLRDKIAPAVVVLGSATPDGKALLVCTVSKELTGRFQAGALIKQVASKVGGGGGGRPDFAQAGGTDGSKLDEALESIYGLVASS